MALKVTEIEVQIVVAELPRRGDTGLAPVMVTQIEDKLCFARIGMDTFILEVASALALAKPSRDLSHFELNVTPRALGLALRRLSGKDGDREVALVTSLGGGYLRASGSNVEYLAPCGDSLTFSRADLEALLETFG